METVRLTTETSALGRLSTTTVWLDPASLAAYQRTLLESGSRARKKIYRFHDEGAEAFRSEPANSAEHELPEPKWTRRSQTSIATPRDTVVTDPLALFYLISTGAHDDLDRGIEVSVLTRNAVNRVRVQRLPDIVEVKSRATIQSASGAPVRSGTAQIQARVYSVTPLANASELRLLGLEGAIEVLVDESLRMPLEIRGKIPPVGSVTVRIQNAVVR